jgi:hypothetical protein
VSTWERIRAILPSRQVITVQYLLWYGSPSWVVKRASYGMTTRSPCAIKKCCSTSVLLPEKFD